MQKQQLAMAEIPVQEMGELYEPEQALAAGTAFPDLNLPFFAVPEKMMENPPSIESYQGKTETQQKKLKKLTEISFVVDDLNLYLCTHPEDEKAFEIFQEYAKQRKQLLAEMSEEHFPLSGSSRTDGQEKGSVSMERSGCVCGIMRNDCNFQSTLNEPVPRRQS